MNIKLLSHDYHEYNTTCYCYHLNITSQYNACHCYDLISHDNHINITLDTLIIVSYHMTKTPLSHDSHTTIMNII